MVLNLSQRDWDDAAGATSYDVCFGACPTPPLPSTVTSSRISLGATTLPESTDHCWQVVSWDDDGCEAAGPLWTFTTTCIDPVAGPPAVTSEATSLLSAATGDATNSAYWCNLSPTGADPALPGGLCGGMNPYSSCP